MLLDGGRGSLDSTKRARDSQHRATVLVTQGASVEGEHAVAEGAAHANTEQRRGPAAADRDVGGISGVAQADMRQARLDTLGVPDAHAEYVPQGGRQLQAGLLVLEQGLGACRGHGGCEVLHYVHPWEVAAYFLEHLLVGGAILVGVGGVEQSVGEAGTGAGRGGLGDGAGTLALAAVASRSCLAVERQLAAFL